MRPGEEEEKKKHEEDKRNFQEMLREHQVDLIVVSADCLEAKKLKNALLHFANLNYDRLNDGNDDDRDKNIDEENENQKEAVVIWGRPEIPKLFA
jgi:soluble P-type ATPase